MQKEQKRGITLIALVITIIVLLILAGISISMLSGDNSILKKASEAKEKSGTTGTKEQIQIATMATLLNGNGKIKDTTLREEIKKSISGISDNDITGNERNGWQVKKDNKAYYIEPNGKAGEAFWETVKDENGNITEIRKVDGTVTGLKIGDTIGYNPIDGATTTEILSSKSVNGLNDQTIKLSDYTGTWRLLGVERGRLLIVSSSVIGNDPINTMNIRATKVFHFAAKKGYQNYEEELNRICSLFGKGRYAESSRSINTEDINKITGYDPNHTEVNINKATQNEIEAGSKFGNGKISQYGNKITYLWDETNNPKYISNTASGFLTFPHNGSFKWYDGKNWQTSEYTGQPCKICELTLNGYKYYPETLSEERNENATIGIKHNSLEYNLLFDSDDFYYLAVKSITQSEYTERVDYGFFCVGTGRVSSDFSLTSSAITSASFGLRNKSCRWFEIRYQFKKRR